MSVTRLRPKTFFGRPIDIIDLADDLQTDIKSGLCVVNVPLENVRLELGSRFADGEPHGGVPGITQLSNKELCLEWKSHARPEPIIFQTLFPMDLNDGADVDLHILAAVSDTNDTPALVVEAYFDDAVDNSTPSGDSDCITDDIEVTGISIVDYSVSIDADDVPPAPCALTIIINPTDGELGSDDLRVFAIWLEYTRKLRTS